MCVCHGHMRLVLPKPSHAETLWRCEVERKCNLRMNLRIRPTDPGVAILIDFESVGPPTD